MIAYRALCILVLIFIISGCEKKELTEKKPIVKSRDFFIEKCNIKYKERNFPINGKIQEITALLGPQDRFVEQGFKYFWDDLGLQVSTLPNSDSIAEIKWWLDETNNSEQILPKSFFNKEFILEGALINTNTNIRTINETRRAYLESLKEPDTEERPIVETWSWDRLGYERFCQNGKHIRVIFRLIEKDNSQKIGSITIMSDTNSTQQQ